MKKFELSLAAGYVANWSIVDAARELFQNAIDEETIDATHTMHHAYDPATETLAIRNAYASLPMRSLLLGSSSKTDNDQQIGQFGEGYKLAALVFTRLGRTMTIYDYAAGHMFKVRFVDSKRYGTKVLTFFMDNVDTHHEAGLQFIIEGITQADYNSICESNLNLSPATQTYQTKAGTLIMDEAMKGNIYVKGLFICHKDDLDCGYDFNPAKVSLGRDRKLMTDFDIHWLTSQVQAEYMFRQSYDGTSMSVALSSKSMDTRFITSFMYQQQYDDLYAAFILEHGKNAIPVSSQEEADATPLGYRAIYVTGRMKDALQHATDYTRPELLNLDNYDPLDALDKWYKLNECHIPSAQCGIFDAIYDRLKEKYNELIQQQA